MSACVCVHACMRVCMQCAGECDADLWSIESDEHSRSCRSGSSKPCVCVCVYASIQVSVMSQ